MNRRKGISTIESIRDRASQLSRRELILFSIIVLFVLISEWLIGQHSNINIVVLLTYVLFLWVLFTRDKRFILEFFWLIALATLNIIGTFSCDEGLFLVELEHSSWYNCSVSPLVALYVIMFTSIEFYRLGKRDVVGHNYSIEGDDTKHKLAIGIGIVIALYLFLQVVRNPYYVVGALRLDYASLYMSSFSVSLRTYLPLFLPIVVMLWKNGKRVLPALFLLVTVGFYILEGDKFGVFFFGAYILALAALPSLSDDKVDNVIKALFVFFWVLIGVVYIQRVLLFDNSFAEFVEVINQRLAQQGEVWWSVFQQTGGASVVGASINSELDAVISPATQSSMNYGQWKMMSVTCQYSAYSAYRISAGNPFTATTTASLIYYFGYAGAVVFYTLIGLIYASLIRNASLAFNAQRILESMIYVKLISVFGNVLFASDITYLFSIQGAVYIMALIALTLMRERKERLNMYPARIQKHKFTNELRLSS